MRVILRTATAIVCAMLWVSPPAQDIPIRVIDGDTLAIGQRRIRLTGYDAPEVRGAKCPAEKARGKAARLRMQEMVGSPERVRLVPSGKRDRWGRELARLTIGGEDVAVVMIREGLAHPYDGRGKRQGWC